MRNKYVSTIALVGVLFQIISFFPANFGKLDEQSGRAALTFSELHDELLPAVYKISNRSFQKVCDLKLERIIQSIINKKNNSLFLIHNQLLPKTLLTTKIHTLFFTFHLTTSS